MILYKKRLSLPIFIFGLIFICSTTSISLGATKKKPTRPTSRKVTKPKIIKPMIEEIIYWPGPENTSITIDLNGAVKYQTSDISGKMGLVLQTENAPFKEERKNIYVSDGLIDLIKIVPQGQGCSITITFTTPTDYEIKKTGKYQNKPELLIINIVRPESLRVKKFNVEELQNWEQSTNGKLVIIDPGHGGFDYGAVGYGGLKEKNITLDLALRLQKRLDSMPNMRAVLTRDGDYYVSLNRRRQIAAHLVNKLASRNVEKKADIIFVSIHLNAPQYSGNRTARGTEIYFLNFSGESDEASKYVANFENEADLGFESERLTNDPMLNGVLAELMMQGFVNESSVLAGTVLSNVKQISMLQSRGVKNARFAVLKVPTPSVLLEVAFITNPYEAQLLIDDGFKDTVMDKLANAIYTFFYARPGLETQPS